MAFTPIDPNKAEVRITGTAPNYGLDFYIPRGERGEIGPQGPIGPATYTNLSVGVVETGPETAGATGPQGLKGDKGDPGGLVQTDLLTTDLNALINVSGAYNQPNSANATTALGYPYAGFIGSIIILRRAQDRVTQIAYPNTGATTAGNVFYSRINTASGFEPWKVFSSSRVDQTAGRVIYEWDVVNNRDQLIYGDTGWRELAATPVTNGVVSGYIRYRRVGQRVIMRFVDVTLSTGATGLCVIAAAAEVPIGFRPAANYRSLQSIGQTNNASDQQVISNYGDISWIRQISNTGISTTRPPAPLSGYIDWMTEDVWPSVLPGTASGSIPNT
ncbi:minor tail protein [Arthrobacter phage Uzumaki]|nr:minor tail protein [Arthrobacter phage Uzumaki]